jgi:hypothetical protein
LVGWQEESGEKAPNEFDEAEIQPYSKLNDIQL